jgi:hypothetical protein
MEISQILQKNEENGLHFYRDCINKTNQYSTKYILQRFIRDLQDQLAILREEFASISDESILNRDLLPAEYSDSLRKVGKSFNISTLTLLEAIRLAIQITEQNINNYRQLLDNDMNVKSRRALGRIVRKKTAYKEHLQTEYDRLRFK